MPNVEITLPEPASRKHTERLAQLIIGASIIIGLFTLLDIFGGLRPYDSTDNGTQRSGMRLHVDAQTGCEYLSVSGGGITPRLGLDGKQAGCRR